MSNEHSKELFFDKLATFLAEKAQVERGKIKPETILISSGLLDSLAVVETIVFVENLIGKPIEVDDFRLITFESMSRIYSNYVSA